MESRQMLEVQGEVVCKIARSDEAATVGFQHYGDEPSTKLGNNLRRRTLTTASPLRGRLG
jgi:hypothetical protein